MKEIVVVEDDKSVARALGSVLVEYGFTATVFNLAMPAIAHISALATPPDAIVIDIHLPDLNGLILSSRLRAQLGQKVPIVMLSGDTSMENINALQFVGATYFLSKPVNVDLLIGRLRELTGA